MNCNCRSLFKEPFLAVFVFVSTSSWAQANAIGGFGGVIVPRFEGDDISAAERADVQRKISEYDAMNEVVPQEGPQSYPFFPQAGTLWQDLFVPNFVDLGGITDFDCTRYTYEGHAGHDSTLRSFQEAYLGVPVFAALDGTVIDIQDWEQDLNTFARGLPSNYVLLDHGGTHNTWYFHLRRGSISVAPGQFVPAGAQIGLTGSSGNSSWPHLHFESRFGQTFYEPSAGPCRPGPSYWVNQIPVRRELYVRNLTLSDGPFDGALGSPWDLARHTGTYVMGPRYVFFEVAFTNVPANSAYRIRYLRPDGTMAVDSNGTLGNPFFREAWFWWYYYPTLDQLGQWRLLVEMNGQQALDAPFMVVSDRSQIVNHPPNGVTIAFDPVAPTTNDVLFCRVQTSLYLRDPDYDIVGYRYQWSVNGTVVRTSLNGALSDALAKGSTLAGDTVTCTVTPTDGQADGPTTTLDVTIRPG